MNNLVNTNRNSPLRDRPDEKPHRSSRLVSWPKAKALIFNGRFRKIDQESSRRSWRVLAERCVTTWAPIGTIAVPIGLGVLLATPAGISSATALLAAARENDSMRLLAIFCALNSVTAISGFMYLIGRQWAMANILDGLLGRMAQVAASVDQLDTNVEALLCSNNLSLGRKKRNAPSTFRHFVSYIGCNPRLWREISFLPVGEGRFRLVPDPDWLRVWIERLCNPELRKLELILFVNRDNPTIAEATGRTLLRVAKLLQVAAASGPAVDLSKVRIYLVESAEVQKTGSSVKSVGGFRHR